MVQGGVLSLTGGFLPCRLCEGLVPLAPQAGSGACWCPQTRAAQQALAAWSRSAGPTLCPQALTFDFYALENVGRLVTPAKKLEDNIRLAELVIEVLQQNEEHHAEVSAPTHTCTRTRSWLVR